MRFPKTIRHRKAECTIYGKSKQYPAYRIAYYAAGRRHMRRFATYTEAKTAAERIVREIASGSQADALSATQARDALAALDRLDAFRQQAGRRVSLLAAVSEYVEASAKLPGRTLGEAVEGYLRTAASVKRKDIKEAVEEFIAADAPRTRADEGQRAQLSAKYAYNREIQLRRFGSTFPNTAVCDLGKTHLDAFIGSLGEFSAKSRNHYRAAVRQFLQWAVRKDYLSPTHRLNEADTMRPERANNAAVQFYAPNELRALLEAAEGPMRAMVALGGLAGLRTSELLRLDWSDVWRVAGHVEITAGKAKTRQRRLIEICPPLAGWLGQFPESTDGKVCTLHEVIWQQHFAKLCEKAGVQRKANGLRHAFCSYHFALHANENLTAQQAGNSPAMIHQHYKGLATKTEAKEWFNVKPSKSVKNVIPLPAAAGRDAQ